MNEKILHQSVKAGTELYRTIDETLKGKEIIMPENLSFTDKDGTQRNTIRIKWWEDPAKTPCKEMSILPLMNLPGKPVDLFESDHYNYYKPDEKPVFFGHYWLTGEPKLYKENVCCIDYSVAKEGKLAAYRFDGEQKLSNDKFIFV